MPISRDKFDNAGDDWGKRIFQLLANGEAYSFEEIREHLGIGPEDLPRKLFLGVYLTTMEWKKEIIYKMVDEEPYYRI